MDQTHLCGGLVKYLWEYRVLYVWFLSNYRSYRIVEFIELSNVGTIWLHWSRTGQCYQKSTTLSNVSIICIHWMLWVIYCQIISLIWNNMYIFCIFWYFIIYIYTVYIVYLDQPKPLKSKGSPKTRCFWGKPDVLLCCFQPILPKMFPHGPCKIWLPYRPIKPTKK